MISTDVLAYYLQVETTGSGNIRRCTTKKLWKVVVKKVEKKSAQRNR